MSNQTNAKELQAIHNLMTTVKNDFATGAQERADAAGFGDLRKALLELDRQAKAGEI